MLASRCMLSFLPVTRDEGSFFMSKYRLRLLIEIALFAAIAMVLDLVIPSTHGFKITPKMLPIIILALRWGTLPGMAGGLLWGILQIVTGEAYVLNAFQVLIEYIVAFSAIGLSGLFHKPMQNLLARPRPSKITQALLAGFAVLTGSLIRYLFHVIAGVIFWSQNIPSIDQAIANSLLVNGSGFLTETVTCLVILLIMLPWYRQLLKNTVSAA